MEAFFTLDALDRLGAVVTIILVCGLVITDRLVWHTRLTSEKARADRWEAIALDALHLGAASGVRAAEVAVGVVSAIPDPERDRLARGGEATS